MSLVVDEHRQYLSDSSRLDAFGRAIQAVVRPGSVVVDLGSGTGILGLLACRAGASRVYSIEYGGMIALAQAVASANGFSDRIIFERALSTEVALPERADVVVADQIGQFGFDAGLWEYFADAGRRFLQPAGVLVPGRIRMTIAPVEAPELFGQVEFWNTQPAGFDFRPARGWAAHTGYPAHLPVEALLAPGAVAADVPMRGVSPVPFRTHNVVRVERPGTLHGLGGWFDAELAPSVHMTNAPGAPQRINRRNVYLPIDRPVPVQPGDTVEITLHLDPREIMVSWTVDVRPVDGLPVHFRHSTLHGMLLGLDDLRRTSPHFRPALTPRGRARRTVLELCDGERPLADIELGVLARHPELFPSKAEAAVFVAEVVTRYAE